MLKYIKITILFLLPCALFSQNYTNVNANTKVWGISSNNDTSGYFVLSQFISNLKLLNGTGTNNTLAMFTGANTIGNSPISTNGTILTSTQPLRVANGTTSNTGLQLGNATDGLYYNTSDSRLYIQNTFGMVMESPYAGRQFNIGTNITGALSGLNVGGTQTPNLNLSGTNPKIYLRGDVNSFDPEINFFGALTGDAALGGAYAQISGNGGLIFKTSAAASVGMKKEGLSTGNEEFRYLQITNNLKNNNAVGGIGTATNTDARYNNLNLLTFANKPSGTYAAQNDYLGGIIAKADNTAQGDVPRASINFKYVGTNMNDASQQKYDIDFNIHTNGSGGYSYPFVNRFKIKDNGNVVLNSTLEIEAPSTPPTMADDGKVLAYDNSVGRARLLTAKNIYNTDGALLSDRYITNPSNYLLQFSGAGMVNFGVPTSPAKVAVSNTTTGRTGLNVESVGASFRVDNVGGGTTISYAPNTNFFNANGSTQFVGINSNGINNLVAPTSTTNQQVWTVGTNGLMEKQTLTKTQAITMSSGQSSITLDCENMFTKIFEIEPSAAASSFSVSATNLRDGGLVFIYFLNNTGSNKTVSWNSSIFINRSGSAFSNITLTTNDGGAAYRCYSTASVIRTQ